MSSPMSHPMDRPVSRLTVAPGTTRLAILDAGRPPPGRTVLVNRFGRIAKAYWETYLPSRVAAIPQSQREAFFTDLGCQVEDEVVTLSVTMAGPDPAGEGYLEKVGRLSNARLRAEQVAMADLVYLRPEPGTEDLEPPVNLPPGVQTP